LKLLFLETQTRLDALIAVRVFIKRYEAKGKADGRRRCIPRKITATKVGVERKVAEWAIVQTHSIQCGRLLSEIWFSEVSSQLAPCINI